MKPEEFSEGTLTSINEKNAYRKKHKVVPKEVTLAKKFPLMKLLKIFQNSESPKDKLLEADVHSEGSMKIFQSREKMHTPYNVTQEDKHCSNYFQSIFCKENIILNLLNIFVINKY